MRFSLVIAGLLMSSAVLPAQASKTMTPGTYSFLPRTSSYDPQFDAWRMQVVADSVSVFDPGGNLFLVSVSKMAGDTLVWTDVVGPCTGVVSRYKLARDSVGFMVDLIEDACTDRATAIVTMYLVPAKKP
jgi:hypothetical protein